MRRRAAYPMCFGRAGERFQLLQGRLAARDSLLLPWKELPSANCARGKSNCPLRLPPVVAAQLEDSEVARRDSLLFAPARTSQPLFWGKNCPPTYCPTETPAPPLRLRCRRAWRRAPRAAPAVGAPWRGFRVFAGGGRVRARCAAGRLPNAARWRRWRPCAASARFPRIRRRRARGCKPRSSGLRRAGNRFRCSGRGRERLRPTCRPRPACRCRPALRRTRLRDRAAPSRRRSGEWPISLPPCGAGRVHARRPGIPPIRPERRPGRQSAAAGISRRSASRFAPPSARPRARPRTYAGSLPPTRRGPG